jgi:hypothetical protein
MNNTHIDKEEELYNLIKGIKELIPQFPMPFIDFSRLSPDNQIFIEKLKTITD